MNLYFELFVVIQILSVRSQFLQDVDCIEGEVWFEKCKKCECLEKEKYGCQLHLSSCDIETTLKDVVVFESGKRCHYSLEKQTTICVDTNFQRGLNGKSCQAGTYIHDSYTFCECEMLTRTFKCDSIPKFLATIGICNPGQIVMENICFECSCTFTRFRVCSLSQLCFDGKEKFGECPTYRNVYPGVLQDICTYERYQECYTDFGCPGTQKCCLVTDCFLRCVDPIQ